MVALQMSSPRTTEILLQLFPAMTGHTKSRALEALTTCFSRTSLNPAVSLGNYFVCILVIEILFS